MSLFRDRTRSSKLAPVSKGLPMAHVAHPCVTGKPQPHENVPSDGTFLSTGPKNLIQHYISHTVCGIEQRRPDKAHVKAKIDGF
jgi:hypothetical protein